MAAQAVRFAIDFPRLFWFSEDFRFGLPAYLPPQIRRPPPCMATR